MSQMLDGCAVAGGHRHTTHAPLRVRARRRGLRLVVALTALTALLALGASSAPAATPRVAHDLSSAGASNVIVFTPSMPQSQIQAKLTAIGNQQVPNQQVPNQFGPEPYAIFFEPGRRLSAVRRT